MMILDMGFEMLGEVFNPLGEQSHLHLRGTGIALASGVGGYNFLALL